MTLAAPAYQQHLQEEHDEGSFSSWCKIAPHMHASSETSQHHRAAARTAAAVSTTPRQSPTFRRRRRPTSNIATTQKKELDFATHPTIPTAGRSTVPTSADGCDAPLSLPAPKFSLAVKVASDEEGYILVSQTTGRRWVAISSARKCQFGEVMRAVELTEGVSEEPPTHFAIKELDLKRVQGMKGRTYEDPLREVAAMQYLSNEEHLNVLNCIEALRDDENLYIVTPFYDGGEVFDAVSRRGRLDEEEARPLFRQALEGLMHLKRHGICHRDVSLENLMLDREGVVKLVDFGLALRIPQTPDGAAKILQPQGPCGKLYYMSPEVLAGSSGFDGFAVDVWACGVVLFMMLTGVPPFELALPSRDQRCQIVAVEERLADLLSSWDMSLSPEATGLVQSCLLSSPERRPSLEDLLEHPWFDA